jgi:exopolysaccharide biosynthesis polyprenyl glycosylphosphotransferase
MLRRDRQIRMQVQQVMDAGLFAAGFALAYVVRSNPDFMDLFGLDEVFPFASYLWLFLVIIPVAPMVLEAQGFYNRPLLCSRRTTAWLLFKACLFTSLGLILALFLFRTVIARGVVVLFGFTSFGLMYAKEELVRWARRSKLGQAQYRRRFILVGLPEESRRMRKELAEKMQHEAEVLTELDLNECSVQRLVELLHEHSVNGVILSARHTRFDQVESAIRACELEGVEAWLVADFFRTQISRTSFDDLHGWPVLVFRSTPEASWQGILKHVLDFVLSLAALILLSPLLVLLALLIKITSPGPVLFRQERSGLNGRPFTIYKFRTMVSDAEQRQAELVAMNEMNGPAFKITNDPRITPLGKFLRKFSLDELPQLWNVLRGEMSLVGPRPLPVDEIKRLNDLAHRRRLSVKPGLTCLWQISGRNNVKDFKDWVRLDLEYIDNWSLGLDLKILCRTVPVVLTGAGAK